jgi:two-component system, OmpR family, alkaline phosphatase synthesis response regulator PhoP
MTTRIEHERPRGGSRDPRTLVRRLLVAAGRTAVWDEVVGSLQRDGIECAWVPDATSPASVAADLARSQTVLIVDLAPDPIRGMTLVTTCRQSAREAPVIVIADNPSIEFARRLRLSGVFYLALHPVNAEEVRTVVADAYQCLTRHRSETSRSRATSRVLVVDDDADFIASIAMLLESQGYAVSSARSGKEALEKLRAEPPDLIVLDVMMEYDSAGYEVNSAVKFGAGFECFRHVPILMVSSIEIDPATRFHMAGEVDTVTPDRYLTKPVDVTTFLDTVRVLLGDRPEPATV